MIEETKTSLQFEGFPFWICLAAAVVAFVLAFQVYRRETRGRSTALGWFLPFLRGLAVLLCTLLLAEPVLRHESTRRDDSRLRFVVDGSRSMDVTDPGLSTARKLRLLESAGAELPATGEAYLETSDAVVAIADHLKLATPENLDLEATRDSGERFRQLEAGLARLSNLLPAAPGANSSTPPVAARYVVAKFLEDEQGRQEARWNDGRQADEGARRYYIAKAREALFRIRPMLAEIASSIAADPETTDRLAELGSEARWERMQRLLVGGEGQPGWIERLAEDHEIEVLDLSTGESWWWQRDGKASAELPGSLERPLVASRTDLASTLEGIAAGATEGKGAVILLSDGNHNRAGSPEAVAERLGKAGLPVHTLGFGADQPPPDLAVADVQVVRTVYRDDRLAGRVAVDDTLPAGRGFRVVLEQRVRKDGRDEVVEVWEQDLESTGEGTRLVPFELEVNQLLANAGESPRNAEGNRNVPLALTARVQLKGDGTAAASSDAALEESLAWLAGNDMQRFAVTAMKRKRTVLVLDGRPRWDLRYLKNHFDRDPQWESEAVIGLPPAESEAKPLLPETREELDQYNLIFVGDIPPERFSDQEMEWLVSYVSERGGGLVFVDGARRHLARWAESKGAPLLPVTWKEEAEAIPVSKLRPSGAGGELGALQWSANKAESSATWATLDPPQWIGQIEPAPGAEVLMEAVAGDSGGQPVMCLRRFGAGKVVYLGFDETWRWRKGRDDDPQRRFWMQLADWAGEVPFAAESDTVSLGADRITLEEGGTTLIRARLRDADDEQNWDVDSELEAVFVDENGEAVATVPLLAEESTGLHRGKSAPLVGGRYDVQIRNRDTGETYEDATMEMFVAEVPDLEMTRTALNRSLLGSVSRASGGEFRPEEEAGSILDQLVAMVEKVEESRTTPLWRSWWVFAAIILLLTLEWILRKRAGFV